MEKLNSDEKMTILMKLKGQEIVRVCQTSKELNRICNDDRFNPLWRNKIREEFNIDYKGERGFDEYKYLTQSYARNFYIVVGVNKDQPEDFSANIFDTRAKAEANILDRAFPGKFKYSQIISTLREVGHVTIRDTLYSIEERKMGRNFKNYEKEEELYQINAKKFFDLFGEDEDKKEDIKTSIENTLSDINEDIEGRESESQISKKIKKYAKEIAEEFSVEEYKKEIEQHIIESLLIPEY